MINCFIPILLILKSWLETRRFWLYEQVRAHSGSYFLQAAG